MPPILDHTRRSTHAALDEATAQRELRPVRAHEPEPGAAQPCGRDGAPTGCAGADLARRGEGGHVVTRSSTATAAGGPCIDRSSSGPAPGAWSHSGRVVCLKKK